MQGTTETRFVLSPSLVPLNTACFRAIVPLLNRDLRHIDKHVNIRVALEIPLPLRIAGSSRTTSHSPVRSPLTDQRGSALNCNHLTTYPCNQRHSFESPVSAHQISCSDQTHPNQLHLPHTFQCRTQRLEDRCLIHPMQVPGDSTITVQGDQHHPRVPFPLV